MKNRGFTLIELMIVVAILGILLTILVGAYKRQTDISGQYEYSQGTPDNYHVVEDKIIPSPVTTITKEECLKRALNLNIPARWDEATGTCVPVTN